MNASEGLRKRRYMALVFSISSALGFAPGCGDDTSSDANTGGASGSGTGLDAAPDVGTDTDSGTDPDSATNPDSGTDADSSTAPDSGSHPVGTLTSTIRVNHFGWRPGDPKVAVVLGHSGETIELHRGADASLAGSYTTSGISADEDSGDALSTVDFNAIAEEGAFYLYLPSTGERSSVFVIAPDVYDIVGAVAMRSFFFQRCNQERALPHASDAVGAFGGMGGKWVDGACHLDDLSCPAGPGSADHGALELGGGWHDAGDYQKTLWGRGVDPMLWAFELNPGVWTDGQLNIPESGNGIPDMLDELMWELDFYVKMQRPDGHFMSSVKGSGGSVASPPSASDEGRVYFDTTSPSGNGWSGGGVTLVAATGNAVLALAHAAIVLEGIGETQIADRYRNAALSGWAWLDAATATGDEHRLRIAAAAAVSRLQGAPPSARARLESFSWADWDGDLPWSVTPGEGTLSAASWHVLANPALSSLHGAVRDAAGQAIVDRAFEEQGAYGGLFGGPGNAWDWSWGSNRSQSMYGANLLIAAHFGALGSHGEAEVREQAGRYLHYMLGLNPLNMVYLTNMAAYGGEHSSFQIYHAWFSYTGGDGDNGNASYNGLPTTVVEPFYPYYPDDDQTSTYGPAPGLVPGGPNASYSGSYDIPNMEFPAYAYRDWSVGCDWTGSACASSSWEVTEPMAAYQGPFVLLVAFMMSGN